LVNFSLKLRLIKLAPNVELLKEITAVDFHYVGIGFNWHKRNYRQFNNWHRDLLLGLCTLVPKTQF